MILDDQSLIVGNVTLGGAADFLAYDPLNSFLYASLIGSSSIAIIDTTLESVVSSVAVGTSPGWVAYDPASGTIYSVNRDANTVSMISNASLVKTIALDGLPFAGLRLLRRRHVCHEQRRHRVRHQRDEQLPYRQRPSGRASSDLSGIAYNPSDKRMYVTSYTDDRGYTMNGSQVTGSVGGLDVPIGISFKASTSKMFLVNSGNDTITASWKGASSTFLVCPDPGR